MTLQLTGAPMSDARHLMASASSTITLADGTKVPGLSSRPCEHRGSVHIRAAGWHLMVDTHHNRETITDAQGNATVRRSCGELTEPMGAYLLELAARSPFPMTDVPFQRAHIGKDTGKYPSRRAVLRGEDAPFDSELRQWRPNLQAHIQRVRKRLDEIGGTR